MARTRSRKRPSPAQMRARRAFVAKFGKKPKRRRRTVRRSRRRITRAPVMAKIKRRRRRRSPVTRVTVRRRSRRTSVPRTRRRRRGGGGFAGTISLIPNKGMIMGIVAGVAGGVVAAYGGRKLASLVDPSGRWANTQGGSAAICAITAILGGYIVAKYGKQPKLGYGIAVGGAAAAVLPFVYSKLPAGLSGLGIGEPGGIPYFSGMGSGNYALPTTGVSGMGIGTYDGSPVGTAMQDNGVGMNGMGCASCPMMPVS